TIGDQPNQSLTQCGLSLALEPLVLLWLVIDPVPPSVLPDVFVDRQPGVAGGLQALGVRRLAGTSHSTQKDDLRPRPGRARTHGTTLGPPRLATRTRETELDGGGVTIAVRDCELIRQDVPVSRDDDVGDLDRPPVRHESSPDVEDLHPGWNFESVGFFLERWSDCDFLAHMCDADADRVHPGDDAGPSHRSILGHFDGRSLGDVQRLVGDRGLYWT